MLDKSMNAETLLVISSSMIRWK